VQGIGNRARDFALYGEHIDKFAVVIAGPKMSVPRGINQLDGNSHMIVNSPHGPLDDVPHAQIVANVPKRQSGIDVTQRCGSRDHSQTIDSRQVGQNLFVHAASKIGVVGFRAHIDKR